MRGLSSIIVCCEEGTKDVTLPLHIVKGSDAKDGVEAYQPSTFGENGGKKGKRKKKALCKEPQKSQRIFG